MEHKVYSICVETILFLSLPQLIYIKSALSQYIWQSNSFGNGALSYDHKMEEYKNMELLQKKDKTYAKFGSFSS